ncbi:MAG: hypothetical protein ACSHW7_07630 [Patiriisocius sp.]|uniref:hypothetical protein n=1 Tax=Patiriisocius sp. TaxID=2822396 RepID=UPI003EF8C1F6
MKFFFLIFILCISCNRILNSKYDKYINEEFNLEMTGIISEIKTIEYSYGVVCLSDVFSNEESYVKEIDNKYFCKLYKNKAKLIVITYQLEVGDSIVINESNDKIISQYRNGKLLKKNKIQFPEGNFKTFFKKADSINCYN